MSSSKQKAWVSWSSGKDSAWALHRATQDPNLEVVGLLTTVNTTHDRVAMHAVRRELLLAQARALGLPIHIVELPWPCPNEVYEQRMGDAVLAAQSQGVTRMVFGDLYLEDIRKYREDRLRGTGLEPVFPLWGRPTKELAEELQAAGVVAHLTCVDPAQLAPVFVGRRWDQELLKELPASCDPCGENGEFHTFVSGGPMFTAPLSVEVGETVTRDGFTFADMDFI